MRRGTVPRNWGCWVPLSLEQKPQQARWLQACRLQDAKAAGREGRGRGPTAGPVRPPGGVSGPAPQQETARVHLVSSGQEGPGQLGQEERLIHVASPFCLLWRGPHERGVWGASVELWREVDGCRGGTTWATGAGTNENSYMVPVVLVLLRVQGHGGRCGVIFSWWRGGEGSRKGDRDFRHDRVARLSPRGELGAFETSWLVSRVPPRRLQFGGTVRALGAGCRAPPSSERGTTRARPPSPWFSIGENSRT